MDYTSRSEQDTESIGEKLGKRLLPGSVVALRGELGAGKTAFARGLARGAGYPGRVTSPTYTIVNEYLGGRIPVFHFDLYRIESSDQLLDSGWDDYLDRNGICVVEWSERAEGLLPADCITVRLETDLSNPDYRIITVEDRNS